MPNGDLIVQFETYGDTPWGYGRARLDKDSNVVWRYLGRSHHDFDIAEDGRIYTLTPELRKKRYDNVEQIKIPRRDAAITVLSPDGEELKTPFPMDILAKPRSRRSREE